MAGKVDIDRVRCVVFDFAGSLCSARGGYVPMGDDEDYAGVLGRCVLGNPVLLGQWMVGAKKAQDIAAIVAEHVGVGADVVLERMAEAARGLQLNEEVVGFVGSLREKGVRTVLVTLNMDVFTDVVVGAHGLGELFDVIVNSADVGQLDKETLWRRAFEELGDDIGFADSVLIETNACNLELFGRLGGVACQYTSVASFEDWV